MFKRLPVYKVLKDIKNYFEWISLVKDEKRNPYSKYNKFNLNHNLFYNIYVVITLDSEQMQLPEPQRRQKVIESISSINRYIDEELKFAEYIVPEFNQIYNATDNTPTSTYVVLYRFAFKYPIFTFFFKRIIFLILGIIIYNNINLEKFFEWLKTIT